MAGDFASQEESDRRLRIYGISDAAVRNKLFDAQRDMILAHGRKGEEILVQPGLHIKRWFNLQEPAFPGLSQEQLIRRNDLTPSEVMALFDEAEWHVANSHEKEMPDEVWSEIWAFSRRGGGKLFIDAQNKCWSWIRRLNMKR